MSVFWRLRGQGRVGGGVSSSDRMRCRYVRRSKESIGRGCSEDAVCLGRDGRRSRVSLRAIKWFGRRGVVVVFAFTTCCTWPVTVVRCWPDAGLDCSYDAAPLPQMGSAPLLSLYSLTHQSLSADKVLLRQFRPLEKAGTTWGWSQSAAAGLNVDSCARLSISSLLSQNSE